MDNPQPKNSNDIKAINTTVMLLSQKMGYLVRNEKVLSRNILILNDKLNKLEEKITNTKSQSGVNPKMLDEFETMKSQITELYNKIKGLRQEIDNLKMSLSSLNESFATKAELKELKYLVDAINPLEYVTYKQLKELLKK